MSIVLSCPIAAIILAHGAIVLWFHPASTPLTLPYRLTIQALAPISFQDIWLEQRWLKVRIP